MSAPKTSLLPIELLLSLSTLPLLLLLLGSKLAASLLHDLGQFSEELFRGDRLPFLAMPLHNDPFADRDQPPRP